MKTIYVLSDSTGETAERVIRAALSQFYDEDVRVHRLSKVCSQSDVKLALSAVVLTPGLVVYTLVDPLLSEVVERVAEECGLITVDLLSPLIYSLSRYLGAPSREKPGLLHRIDTDYHRRIDAVNFTVKHDDGQDTRYLYKADLVLVGVSRSSKTPLSQDSGVFLLLAVTAELMTFVTSTRPNIVKSVIHVTFLNRSGT